MMQLTDAERAFLNQVHYAVVGTLNQDGTIQQTVVWYLLEGNNLRFSLGAGSFKARNLRRNPTITLTVEERNRYLTVSGNATVEPVDPDLRYRLAVRYLGPERAAIWITQRPDVERVSVRIAIRRVYGQGV